MDDPHTKATEEVVNYFKTDENTGLDDDQVKRNMEKYKKQKYSINAYMPNML